MDRMRVITDDGRRAGWPVAWLAPEWSGVVEGWRCAGRC